LGILRQGSRQNLPTIWHAANLHPAVYGVDPKARQYDEILTCTPLFSPDGERFAYGARKGGKWRMVVDGLPGPEYEGMDEARRAYCPNTRPSFGACPRVLGLGQLGKGTALFLEEHVSVPDTMIRANDVTYASRRNVRKQQHLQRSGSGV
jgi:hypothetical protein